MKTLKEGLVTLKEGAVNFNHLQMHNPPYKYIRRLVLRSG